MRLSRSVAFQSLSLVAIGGYLGLMVADRRRARGDRRRLFGSPRPRSSSACRAALLTASPRRRLRAWLKVRSPSILPAPLRLSRRMDALHRDARRAGRGGAPLDVRVVKAIADITESPGGLLLLPDGAAARRRGARGTGDALGAAAAPATPPVAPPRGDAAASSSSTRARRRADARGLRAVPGWLLRRDRAPGRWCRWSMSTGWSARRARAAARPTACSTGRISTCSRVAGRQVGELSRRGARAGGAGRRPPFRRVQPPLRLHHARHQESGQPAEPGRPQRRAPCRQSRVPRRHGRDAAGSRSAR